MVKQLRQESIAELWKIDGELWTRGRNAIAFVALISWVAALTGWVLDPQRFLQSYLVGFLVALAVPLGALFFLMVGFLTGSAWSVPMRRVAENILYTIPAGALLFLPIALGVHELYEWSHAEALANDLLLRGKSGYLNPQWFVIRAAIYFAVWSLWANRLYTASTRQDRTGSLEQMHQASRWSAPGLPLTFVTVSLASFDWIMSLDPHWYSTIFGLYFFSGAALTFIAVWTLACLWLRDHGVLREAITVEHYHDFGKWMFALTVFWAYLGFSQYMLIWYGNLPEETTWFHQRLEGSWKWWSALLLVGHFIVPFLVLISRPAKRKLRLLRTMALWFVAMEFVDIYWLVMPGFQKQGVALHWLDAAAVLACGSALALVFWARMKRHPLIPIGDPRLEQGLEFHNI
ncbi:MAG: hypothetical protein HYZ57_10945 [Acidobacteria bacterium]|nr:hypothetical protein [Acidobacteriota bacterium]MBI3280346.1 hypothetical protein [Acidobacteriota bacterium]